ncbi:MAG: hypothetical protein VXZ38_04305 [Planctomycetota bacterium]|nr:hypothetical protein [Planctomycetota bacterium]
MLIRILVLQATLSLLLLKTSWGAEPIVEIADVQPKETAFVFDGARKPVVIYSVDDITKYFDAKNSTNLKSKVDFSQQEVLVFAWLGSGQDRIEYEALESFPEQIHFSYRPGRTRDLRQHVKIFVIRSDVKCIVNGKIVSDVEVRKDGQWSPTKLPLAGLVEGKAVEVRVRGILRNGMLAIGGETTGTTIRFGKTTWELELQNRETLSSAAAKLNGKLVVVSGLVRTEKGIEVAMRTILTVESLASGLTAPERIKTKPPLRTN